MRKKPILCLDFDGVLHSYTSGWKGADVIPDPPVPGAMAFVAEAMDEFNLQIFSSRSNQPGGIKAMQKWLAKHLCAHHEEPPVDFEAIVRGCIGWPTAKPPAMVTIDDRAVTFTGTFPSIDELKRFKPWNKQEGVMGEERQFPIHPTDRERLESVPWSLIAPHEDQAFSNHGQSLEKLARRGGLGLIELALVIEPKPGRNVRNLSLDTAEGIVRFYLRRHKEQDRQHG